MNADTSGSPMWQTVFVSFAVVLILFEVVRGWRLGLPRQMVRLAAMLAAYAAAFFGGEFLVPLLRPVVKLPDIVISAIGGVILALIVFSVITTVGAILFKRTSQQGSRVVRLIYGISGAILGIGFGAFVLWLLLVGLRSVGEIADAQVHAQTRSANVSTRSYRPASSSSNDDSDLLTTLAKLKNSVELGPVGDVVKSADVLPTGSYRALGKIGEVLSAPASAERFLTFPGARALSEHPKIVALREDPEIMEMITQGRFLDLLQDRRLIEAVNDPTLVESVKKFDLQKALDYAGSKKPDRQ